MTCKLILPILCLLIQLILCQRLDAERITRKRVTHQNHNLRRRAAVKFGDQRFLDFHFLTEPDDSVISPNSSALFNCQFDFVRKDQSDVRIEWRKDGVPVSSVRSVGRVLIIANGSLLIENPIASDEGFYQCAVFVVPRIEPRFTWTFLSRKGQLQIPVRQVFEVEPVERKVRLHQPVGFQCVLSSSFPDQIEWYKDDRRIYEGDDGYHILPISQSLEIRSAQKKHEGNYKCVVRVSGAVKQSREVPLEVVNSAVELLPIQFVFEPKKQIFGNIEGNVILECLVNGSPHPRIRWLKDTFPVDGDDGRIKFVGVEQSSLLIEKLQVKDSGVYTCRAENGEDSLDASSTLLVRVPPRIGKAPLDRITQETSDVEFDCSAEQAVPAAGIAWYKNGERILPSEYFVMEKEKLKILGLVRDDQGVYQCIVDNDVGSAQAAAQLIVDPAAFLLPYLKDSSRPPESVATTPTVDATHLALTAAASTGIPQVPTEPLGLKVTNLASRLVSLKWDKPLQPHGEILNYHVFFREEDSTRERTLTTPVAVATIGELRPGSVYLIRIAAENRVGLGKSTGEFKITTATEQAIPSRIRNLRANVLTSESVEVLWDPPASNVDETIRYKLYYIRRDRKSVEEETQVHMVKTSYILHDLDKDSEYSIRVEPESSNGAGPSSDSIVVRTFTDAPSGPPTHVRAEALESGSVRVSWKPPAKEERNGPITGYKIKFKTRRRGSKGSIVVVDGDPGEYVLNGLESGVSYTVRMAAINQNGTGPFTDWIEVDTLLDDLQDTLISAPRSLRVHASHDSIFLSWDPPVTEGVIVRGYEIGWGPGVPDQEKARVDSHVRSYTIKGLKPSREYVVALRGFNNAGPGFPIYETIRTTAYGHGSPSRTNQNPHTPTATPMGVRAEAESSSSIRVSWTDPSDVFNPLYTVKYSSPGDNSGAPRYANTSENEVTIKDLRPNTYYEFAVRLVDSPHWSMTVGNRTQPAPPSSPPRDLTVVPPSKSRHVDPNSVTLHWQPPKYANGEVSDYSVLYTHRPEQDDKDWIVDSVRGDQLSMNIRGLIPQTVYYFKIQARNVKGIGPFSPQVRYEPEGYFGHSQRTRIHATGMNSVLEHLIRLWETNKIYVILGAISIVFVLIVILLTICCVQRSRKSPRRAANKGYIQGRKQSSSVNQNQRDFWIGAGTRPYEATAMHDLKHDLPVDSPPPRYQTVQVVTPMEDIMTQSHPSPASLMLDNTPLRHSMRKLHRQSLPPTFTHSTKRVHVCEPPYSAAEDSDSAIVGSSRASSSNGFQAPVIMNAKRATLGLLQKRQGSGTPTLLPPGISREGSSGVNGSSAYVSDAESNGTISRSYHHSSTSLEGRQRTPQIVYTGNNRQPIAKIDFNSDHASSYGGSSTGLQMQNQTPPPTFGDYRTLRQPSTSSNPLKSFTQLANGPPPLSPSHGASATLIGNHGEMRTAQIVRPTIVNPSGSRGSPLNSSKPLMGSQKQLKQVGRATAQPRINMAGMYSPYASTRDVCGDSADVAEDYPHETESDRCKLQEAPSMEGLPINEIDDMLKQLKELQQDFQN